MNIYLYGIGPKTQNYIDSHPKLHICGILDGFRQEGIFCSIPILSIEDLDGIDSEIIIIARKASTKIIYDRIRQRCFEKGITIKDEEGNILTEQSFEENIVCALLEKTAEEIVEETQCYETVSFDIFDTLLKRKCGSADKLWAKIQLEEMPPFQFAKERMRAEKELSAEKVPTYEEIYKRIQENITVDEATLNRLKELEFELDKEELYPNPKVVSAFQLLLEKGKEIFLLSDMYYSKRQLAQILSAKSITGYKDIIVSSEYGTGKAGRLYDIYKNRIHFALVERNKKAIHVGDSEYEDCQCALKHQIASCLIQKPYIDMSAYDIGCKLLAPGLLGFCKWIHHEALKAHIDKIYFLARDGFLIKQIYDTLPDALPSGYLMISRSVVMPASILDERDICRVMQFSFDGTSQEMLENRFQIPNDQIEPMNKECPDRTKYILRHKAVILKHAENMRKNFLTYLKQENFYKNRNIGVFDFVSTGTCQICLEKISGKKVKGYYFEKVYSKEGDKRELDVIDYVTLRGEKTLENYFRIEPLIKSIYPSVKNFNMAGEPVYAEQRMSIEQQEFVKKVQCGVMEGICDTEVDEEEAYQRLRLIGSRHVKVTDEVSVTNYDEFCSRNISM